MALCLLVNGRPSESSASNRAHKPYAARAMNHPTALIATEQLIALLERAAITVSGLEQEAEKFLYQENNKEGYAARLRQKAILLSGLIDEVEGIAGLPAPVCALIQERVGSVSYEAERALRVDSVFYMAVLLYPEHHRPGMPNELEELVARLDAIRREA